MTKQDTLLDIQSRIEAILFSYGEWISISEIMDILKLDSELMVKNAIEELKSKFKEGFSFKIVSEDGKFRMVLKSEYEYVVEDLVSGVEIPQKVLKVLSVIAYEQPITKTRLSEILGRYVKPEVDYLYKHKFISYEKKGNGKYYQITKKFYEYFNLDENDDFRGRADKTINSFLGENLEKSEDLTLKSLDKLDNEVLKSPQNSDKLIN